MADTTINTFKIEVDKNAIVDLKQRLANRRIPDQISETTWEYGTDSAYLQSLLDYWQHEFNWRKHEALLNQFDQYVTRIEGLDIHFIHQRSPNANAIPLLLLHGWPGSIAEFHKIIQPLCHPSLSDQTSAPSFHIVAPSLPGFGFSDKPKNAGYSAEKIAHLMATLMARLGYDRYGLQGGDWGGIIHRYIAAHYADRIIGLHSNFLLATKPLQIDGANKMNDDELKRWEVKQIALKTERGYSAIQATKPQTLGYGLNDSPAGLAAWIVEKFYGWSDLPRDEPADLNSLFSMDELLMDISIYWFTQTITSSCRIYYENRLAQKDDSIPFISVPTGAAIFPAELVYTPRAWADHHYNIVHWTEMPRGGHFAALEVPDLLIDDIRTFFGNLSIHG